MNIEALEETALTTRKQSLRLRAADVTGSIELETSVDPEITAGLVARSLAETMELPTDTPWGLLSDQGRYLDDARQIGEQVEQNARLTLTPKAHLG